MAFQFRLQKVLDHRRRLEDEAKREFMAAQAKTVQSLKDLENLYVAIDVARARAHTVVTGPADRGATPALQHIDLFINGQKFRIEEQRRKIRELKSEEERLQDLLIFASREKKILEKLREKHLAEYRVEVSRREQEEIDDLTVMRHRRGEGP